HAQGQGRLGGDALGEGVLDENALGGEQGGAANGQAIVDHVDGWRGGLGGGGGHGSSSFAPSKRASGRGFKGRYGQIRPSFSAGGSAFPSPRPSPRRGEGAMESMALRPFRRCASRGDGPWRSFRGAARYRPQYRSGWWRGLHDQAMPGWNAGRRPGPADGWRRNGAAHGAWPRAAGRGRSAIAACGVE